MKYVAFFILIFFCCGCGMIKGHDNPVIDYTIKAMDEIYVEDNILEEIAEDTFEDMTGLEIDLSPNSEEE